MIPRWLVVRQRDGGPSEVYPFGDEVSARLFYDEAQTQWTETYLCEVRAAPGASLVSLPLDTAKLVEEVGWLRRERVRLTETLSRTCEQPADGCDCPGCSALRRWAKEVG